MHRDSRRQCMLELPWKRQQQQVMSVLAVSLAYKLLWRHIQAWVLVRCNYRYLPYNLPILHACISLSVCLSVRSVGPLCIYEEGANSASTREDCSSTFTDYFRTLQQECRAGQPGVLQWTPDKNTPDTVYYQVSIGIYMCRGGEYKYICIIWMISPEAVMHAIWAFDKMHQSETQCTLYCIGRNTQQK